MTINEAWEKAIEIRGIEDNYTQSIDDDQVIDDNGKACYKSYCLVVDADTDECHYFTATEMEEFAKTW